MTAWQWLLQKGVGATAFAILLSNVAGPTTWDALVQKSSAPAGSTAWVHLISVLDQVETVSGGSFTAPAIDDLMAQARREDDELLRIIMEFLRRV